MNKSMIALAAVAIVLASFIPSSAQQAISVHDPGFRHPVARNAHRAYQQAMQQAWAEYQAKVAEAQTAYLAELDRAAEMSQRGGYEEEVQKIVRAKAVEAEAARPVAASLPSNEWYRIMGSGGLPQPVVFRSSGVLDLPGSNSWWSQWTLDGDRLNINDRQALRAVRTVVFVGQDSRGVDVYLFPKLTTQ